MRPVIGEVRMTRILTKAVIGDGRGMHMLIIQDNGDDNHLEGA